MTEPKRKDYLYIQGWHFTTGSLQPYVDRLVDRANEEKAPDRAVFRRDDGTWVTIDQIPNRKVVKRVQDWVDSINALRKGRESNPRRPLKRVLP